MKLTKKKKSKKIGLVGICWPLEILKGRDFVIIDGTFFTPGSGKYKSYLWERWWKDGILPP